MNANVEILIIACLVALSCALPGVFLVLRRVALMSDAISHAILFGIVTAFFFVKSIASPWLLVGATLTGVLTVTLTEMIIKTKKLKEDAAIGLVFPLLFSIGVILISRGAENVHLDVDAVLLGELAFAPFNRLIFVGRDLGPIALWQITPILMLNVAFIVVFYKELKVSVFDPGLAAAMGFAPVVLHYALMTVTSITCVGAFESVGSILVVALMIAPPAAAYLITDRLFLMVLWSGVIGICSALSGYALAYWLDANIAGAMATMSGVLFVCVWLWAPERGLLARYYFKRFKRFDFGADMLAVHLLQSEYLHATQTENVVSHMKEHMLWEDEFTSAIIAKGVQEGWVRREGDRLILTRFGREKARNAITKV